MKHTSIKLPYIPTEFNEIMERWRSEGFAVEYNVLVGLRYEKEAVEWLMEDIAEEHPDYEPLETVSACHDTRFYVAAKCRIRKEEK